MTSNNSLTRPKLSAIDSSNKGELNGLSNLLSQIIGSSPVATFVIDLEHRVTHWNHACELVTGIPAKDIVGRSDTWRVFYESERPVMADLILDDQITDIRSFYKKGTCRRSAILEEAWEAKDFFPNLPGGGKWLAFSANPLKDENGMTIGAVQTLLDITEHINSGQHVKNTQHLLTQIIEACPVPLFVLGKDHTVAYWNRACEAIIGTPAAEIVGTKNQWKAFYAQERPVLADLVLENRSDKLAEYYKGIWSESELIKGAWEATDFFPKFKNGAKWLYFTAAPIHGKDGETIGAVETLQDISSQKEYEEKLKHEATHDALTGLANRVLLEDRLKQAIAYAEREGHLLAILFIDLDNFKTVNDTLGHTAGDQLIRDAAKSITSCVRSTDTVARLGGDEFVVVLFSPENEEYILNAVERLNHELKRSYTINNQEFHISASIGIALYPNDGKDVDTLMMNADSAMYETKGNHKGSFRFFTPEMNIQARRRLEIETSLHRAVKENQFVLYYQPIIDMKSGDIVAAEALIRWQHPEKGLVSPDEFIPIAEESDLIIEIGNWVFESAVREACVWHRKINRRIRVSINVSPRQFYRQEIHKTAKSVLGRIHDSLPEIELELTENLVMHDPLTTQASLAQLRDLGLQLAMDDFGTGYSSLAYIHRFPFNMVKIDKAFIRDIGINFEVEAIVRTMLSLGKALGICMVAEGVETKAQYNFLKNEGCDEVQGYYLGGPVSGTEFRRLLYQDDPVY